MYTKNFKTIEVYNNTKAPLKKWLEPANQHKGRPTSTINYGILTGKINNIIVIDCDFYKAGKEEHDVLNIFEDYKKNILNTYTVLTPRKGLHYYFKYDPDILNTNNSKYNIDVKSDGAYIVGPGSVVNDKEYKVIHDIQPAAIPENIKKWLMCNLYTAEKKRKTINKEKNRTENPDNNKIVNEYNINVYELKKIIYKLDAKYWKMDDHGFLKFTTFCKYFNIHDLWDEINKTKPNYNYTNNINHFWNTADIEPAAKLYNIIDKILYEAGNNTKIYTSYYKYRPTPKNEIQPDLTINNNYLDEGILQHDTNYMIKSDTGTGKTTLFKKYVKKNNYKFISIVSRVSLANEQYRVFNEYGIQDIKHYNYDNYKSFKNYNIVIQIDSLLKLRNFDFSEYIIFLDEVNSIIHHLITSPTLNDKSAIIYKLFIKLLSESKQIIGTDADINDTSLKFLRPFFNFKYIMNTKKHNKDVKTTEIKNIKLFIEQLKKESRYLVATDSASVAEHIYTELKKDSIINIDDADEKNEIKLITSYTSYNDLDLDEHDKIIFSPKILYGLDSSMSRPVFCYYKEHTISPISYIQQISRCRSITHLYYTFESKLYKDDKKTLQDLEDDISDENILLEKIYTLKELLSDKQYKHYLCSYISYQYIELCYNTNKFAHFLKLLNDRGFIINSVMLENDKKDKKETKKAMKETKEHKLLTFNYNDYPIKHKLLGIPDENNEDIEKYKEYYFNEYLLQEHKNIIKTINNTSSELKNKIEQKDGTKNTIISSSDHKIILLKKLKKTFKIKEFNEINILEDDYNNTTKYTKTLLYEEYKQAFKKINKIKDFNNVDNVNKCVHLIYTSLYGKIIKKTKKSMRIKDKVKTFYNYEFDDDFYKFNLELYEHTKNKEINKKKQKEILNKKLF